jgi:hypothetical protein
LRPAPETPLARHQPGTHQRREGQRDGGGVAARVGDEGGAAQRGPVELREAVARLGEERRRGVLEAVPPRISGRVVEPEGTGEIDDLDAPGVKGRPERQRDLGGRGQEGQVGPELGGLRLGKVAESGGGAGERQPRSGGLVGPPVGVERRERETRMAGDDAGQLEPGVPGGPDHGGGERMHGVA